jgi:NAD(P)-dependent dehydrogenase (short-subunit alcohol dehydrogenase family)
MNRFTGKRALVTGAGQGIGFEICRQFALEGAVVALNDKEESLSIVAAKRINQEISAERVFPLPADISAVKAFQALIRKTDAQFGGIDILVANAGLTVFSPFLSCTPEAFDTVMGVNLRGTYFSAQTVAQCMIDRQIEGRIILMSSVTSLRAHHNLSAYGMTKAALNNLAQYLALELGPQQITVNALAPGATVTERTQLEIPQYEETWQKLTLNKRAAHVSDIAAATLFLASEEARHITGQTLTVDGGWSARSPLPGD